MTNNWLMHVRKTMKEHPGQPFILMLKRANRTYKKGGHKKNHKKKHRKSKKHKKKHKKSKKHKKHKKGKKH
jgi:hypothetical protein